MKASQKIILTVCLVLGVIALTDGCGEAPQETWVKKITDLKSGEKQSWSLEYDKYGRLVKYGDTSICYTNDEIHVGCMKWESKREETNGITYKKRNDGLYTSVSECCVDRDSISGNYLKESSFLSSGDTIYVSTSYFSLEDRCTLRKVTSKYVYDKSRRLTDVLNSYMDGKGDEVSACHSYYEYEDRIVSDSNLDFSTFVVDCDGLDVFFYFLLGMDGEKSSALPDYIRYCVNHGVATYQGEALYRMAGDCPDRLEVVSDDMRLKVRLEVEYYSDED